jgi:hypothetical protein
MLLMILEPVSLSSANVTEKMVQEQIAEDPSIPAGSTGHGMAST